MLLNMGLKAYLRTKGWRMPRSAVYVGRPSPWGNPWRVTAVDDPSQAVEKYRRYAVEHAADGTGWLDPLRDATALVCWCSLDQPCHADVLIELLADQATR